MKQIHVAVGACSEVACRLRKLEEYCLGIKINEIQITTENLEGLAPIDDIRAVADYRMEVVVELIQRAILQTC